MWRDPCELSREHLEPLMPTAPGVRCRLCRKLHAGTGLCPPCYRLTDEARGRRQQRGYDVDYDRKHREWQRRLDAGERVTCWRCAEQGKPHTVDPTPGQWHLGHDNQDRSIIRGPQCPGSNLADAGRRIS